MSDSSKLSYDDQAVERVARALAYREGLSHSAETTPTDFDECLNGAEQDEWRDLARAAIAALAQQAQPFQCQADACNDDPAKCVCGYVKAQQAQPERCPTCGSQLRILTCYDSFHVGPSGPLVGTPLPGTVMQPAMPTRESVSKAMRDTMRDLPGWEANDLADAVLALFAPKETACDTCDDHGGFNDRHCSTCGKRGPHERCECGRPLVASIGCGSHGFSQVAKRT